MSLRIGPKALDPMAGYVPSWSPAMAPEPPGRGIPKWRGLFVFIACVVLLSNLPNGGPTAVQADQFTMPGGTCMTTDKSLVGFDMTGYSAFSISFKLVTTGGGPFRGAWQTSANVGASHWPPPAFWYGGASDDPDKTFYIYGGSGGAGTTVTLDGNRSGRVDYVIGKAATYAGCFSVSEIVVTRWPSVFPPNPQATPTPLPSPTPGASQPTGYDCNGSSHVEDCDIPPDGWCWVEYAAPYGSIGHRLEECELPDEQLAVSTCAASGSGSPIVLYESGPFSTHISSVGGYNDCYIEVHQTGDVDHWDIHPTNQAWAGGTWCLLIWSGADSGNTGGHPCGEEMYSDIPRFGGKIAISPGGVQSMLVRFDSDPNVASVVWNLRLYEDGSLVDGEPGPSGDPFPAPSGFPGASGLPNDPGGLGGPVDQCEGPDDYGLALCQPPASFNVNICPSGSNILLCQPVPSAYPNASGDIFTGYAPDPSGFMEAIAEKAPFGLVGQLEDALGGALAAPAGPDVDLCSDIPVMGDDVEFCIPTAPFEAIGEWRPLMAGVVWLATALALLVIVVGSVGGKTADAKE